MSQTSPSTNPHNDLPTVRLLNLQGDELMKVSQRQACHLLRAGLVTLVPAVPPGVQMVEECTDIAFLQASLHSSAGPSAHFLQARRTALYGNVTFQGPEGQTMFHGDEEKALWYLNRGLVEVVSTLPVILRFTFRPGGPGHAGDVFYLTGKVNRCVVCGETRDLNRHHVVPSVYRRHLPSEVKDHAHHDVVLLCLDCHEAYERAADERKAELGQQFGVPLHGLHGERDRARVQAVKLAHTLLEKADRIPEARRAQMREMIAAWFGRYPEGEADLREVSRQDFQDEEAQVEHGRHVVASMPDLEEFVRQWRQHFVTTMCPNFLPEHWAVDRPVRTNLASSSETEGSCEATDERF